MVTSKQDKLSVMMRRRLQAMESVAFPMNNNLQVARTSTHHHSSDPTTQLLSIDMNTDDDEKRAIATPALRRSGRTPKTTVAKAGRSINHKMRSPIPAASKVFVPQRRDRDASVLSSPLCVKKKMCRRALLISGNAQPNKSQLGIYSKKKLPIVTAHPTLVPTMKEAPSADEKSLLYHSDAIASSSSNTSVSHEKHDIAPALHVDRRKQNEHLLVNCTDDELQLGEMNMKGIASIHLHHPSKLEDSTSNSTSTKNIVDKAGSLGKTTTSQSKTISIEADQSVRLGCNMIDTRGININNSFDNVSIQSVASSNSVLFDESSDFWDGFLLDTYQQVAVNKTEACELIPYQVLARGIAVDTKKRSASVSFDKKSSLDRATKVIPDKLIVSEFRKKSILKKSSVPNVIHNGMITSIKSADSTCNQTEVENFEQGSKLVVGIDSWQMNVINRMIHYLDNVADCPYSKHSKQFHNITEQCMKQHYLGDPKYHHLPGSIFERLVSVIGGPTFLSIYMGAKALQHSQFDFDAIAQEDDYDSHDAPNLFHFAVGYGYCMAKSINFNGQAICPAIVGDNQNLSNVVEFGAQSVLLMSKKNRAQFWKDFILHENGNI